ncbi:MAG: ATP-binding cassette domain-containing protein [Candidatus Hydrogenedentes bacterium]|nr:ATP-binding cassette domain-containing protein [Candidatus Hydrogenedentota bacterium]
MIEVAGLTKYYGTVPAIEDLTFTVNSGEIMGFLGPNGAGKTTTMRILTGFSPASWGTAKVAGFDVKENPLEVKRRVGYLPESVPLYTEMLVTSFLRYAAEVKGVDAAKRSVEVGRVVERCGLTGMEKRVIGNLSKGYRQRVGLAQALIGNPEVLILDEPTVGLDPAQIIEIRAVIKELAREHTVLLSTHILPEVAMLCERVIILHQGHIVAQDSMRNLAGSDTMSLTVEVHGAKDAIIWKLQTVEGVRRVVPEGPEVYLVESKPKMDIREGVAKAIAAEGFGLRRLEERTRTLEDVFIEALSTEQGGMV